MGISFKQRLSSLISAKGHSPASLAKELNIGKSTFHNWVNNEAPNLPRIDDADKIAKALGVTLDYLYTGNELYNLDSIELELINLVKSLDKDEKRELLGIVKREVRIYNEGKQKGGTGSGTQTGRSIILSTPLRWICYRSSAPRPSPIRNVIIPSLIRLSFDFFNKVSKSLICFSELSCNLLSCCII